MKRASLGLLLILALLVLLPATVSSPVIAQPSGTTFVARFGDPLLPPFPGGTVDQLSPPDVNNAGQTSFYVRSSIGPCGVEIGDGASPPTPYIVDGNPGPDGPLYFCSQLTARALTNNSNAIAYAANVGSAGGLKGLYVSLAPGNVVKIVKQGDPSTNPPGTFGPPALLDFNDSGTVLFSADVTGDTVVDALFSGSGYPTINTLVKVGDPLPLRLGGGSIASLASAVMDNAGKVAFEATVTGGSVSEAIFLRGTNGALTRVVAANDVWFSSLALGITGTEEAGAECGNALDDDGDTRINDGCPAVGPPERGCRNPIDNDGDTTVNDGCPTMSEVRFLSVDAPAINDSGVVAFKASLPSPYSEGFFLVETASAYEDGSASCFDGVDNGGDTLADNADGDCSASTDPHEDGNASCGDNIDNGSDGATDNGDSDCLRVVPAVLPENPSIVGEAFGGGGCGYDLAGSGPHLLGGGGAFGGGLIQVGCGGDPLEAVIVFPAYQKLVIDGEVIPGGGGVWTGFSDPAISDSSFAAFKATATSVADSIVVTPGVCAKDSDGDGLCDDWEQNGMDENNDGTIDLNLPGMGADKDKKDIFVEIDYMDCGQKGCASEDGAGLGTCGDGIDNTGDTKIDLADADCNAVGADTHHHRPVQAAINNVVNAFANSTAYNPTDAEGAGACNDGVDNDGDTKKDAEDSECTGINLHVTVDEAIPHYQYLDFPPAGNVANPQPCVHGVGGTNYGGAKPYSFNAVKGARFGTAAERGAANWKAIKAAKQKVFHYVLFSHTQAPNNTSSGCAEIHGNDFYVSLGAWGHEDGAGPFTCSDGVDNGSADGADAADGSGDCTSGVIGTQGEHEGTFMHELGHNLDLEHGGGDSFNYKPNYLSVMNYTFQMPYIVPNRPLDYSRWVLPTPVEDGSGVLGSCADGVDNAADTVKDSADPDCQKAPGVQDEGFMGIVNSCGDAADNDGDTVVDLDDPDCSVGLLNEFSLIENEGIDDGTPPTGLAGLQTAYTEFPNEYGVDGNGDTAPDDLDGDTVISKADNEKGAGSCYDNIDNDRDGKIDAVPGNNDPDCSAAQGGLPLIGEGRDTCWNGLDDDSDTLVNAQDPDCQCQFRRASATGAIDWNINGSIEGAGANVNVDAPIKDPEDGGNYTCWTAVPFQTPAGWDDWHNLNLNFRQALGNYSDGLPNVPLPEEQENPPVLQPPPTGPVGGIADLPDVRSKSGLPGAKYMLLAAAGAAALASIAAGTWYAGRRFSRG